MIKMSQSARETLDSYCKTNICSKQQLDRARQYCYSEVCGPRKKVPRKLSIKRRKFKIEIADY